MQVYVIGGIVDHNRLKGLTYNKAVELGIETAKYAASQPIPSTGHWWMESKE